MINIVLCFDYEYSLHYKHVINSILANTKSPVFFSIVSNNIFIEPELEKLNIDYQLIIMGDSGFNITPTGSVKSQAQYWRFNIPEFIKDRAIYLDNDVIVNCDIKELWELDIADNYIAAATCPFHHTLGTAQRFQGIIPPEYKSIIDSELFLSGQLLINCELWRRDSLKQKLIKLVKDSKICDMLAMNLICHNRIYRLSSDWSYPAAYTDTKEIEFNGLKTTYSDIKIYHWHGKNKPWLNSEIKNKEIYLKYK